jgi:hypothetical protein
MTVVQAGVLGGKQGACLLGLAKRRASVDCTNNLEQKAQPSTPPGCCTRRRRFNVCRWASAQLSCGMLVAVQAAQFAAELSLRFGWWRTSGLCWPGFNMTEADLAFGLRSRTNGSSAVRTAAPSWCSTSDCDGPRIVACSCFSV